MSEATKICRKCNTEKPLSEYYPQSDRKDGHRSECKECTRAARRARPVNKESLRRSVAKDKAKAAIPLTLEVLKSLLIYNPDTGEWLGTDKYSNRRSDTVGTVRQIPKRNAVYLQIHINGKFYYAHRLAWFYMTGEWPKLVDHIDGDGLNNKWENLRSVSDTANQRNVPLRKANKSGIHGVRWSGASWSVTIGVNGITKYLGSRRELLEACCLRKSAENRYGYHANHGRPLNQTGEQQ